MLKLVAAGLNNQTIAEQLFLSEHTVHRHVANILNKLSVSSRAAAVAQAARRGLLGSLARSGHFGFALQMTLPWDAPELPVDRVGPRLTSRPHRGGS